MDYVLCFVCCARLATEFREYIVLWHGICWDGRYVVTRSSDLPNMFLTDDTSGMTWGWAVAMIGIQAVAASMAELCSSMPTSGGLYYASAVLAPEGWGPFAAWITGWSNWLGQITGAPSVNYGTSSMILAAVSIGNPAYVPQNYQVYLLTVFLMLIHGCMASLPTKWIARVNNAGSTFNMLALVVVIILIPAGTNREEQGLPRFTKSSEVWGDIYEGTAFPSGVGVLMSFIGVVWTMSGFDAPFHLSEECSNANIASPRAIFLTSAVGGTFGWFLQLVVAYTVVDIGAALESDLGQPFAAYLTQVLPQKTVLAVLALTIVAGFAMGQGCMIAASRVTFAYARDDCFPLSKFWKKVNPHTQTPVNAVWFNTVIGCILLLLIFGGSLAAGALFSIGAIAAFVAFTTPVFIRVVFVGNNFRAGPWNLGRFSIPIGIVASCFTILMIPILCLPAVTGSELGVASMNWTCLVYGGPMFAICIWWVVSARKWFKGPKVNVSHMMLGDTIEGQDVKPPSMESEGSVGGKAAEAAAGPRA